MEKTVQVDHHTNRTEVEERAVGCLLGLAVGDAIGDLGRSDAHRQRWGIITEMFDGAQSTDDTEFAILTGQTLLDCGGRLTSGAVVAAWQRYIIDQGGLGTRGGKPLYGAVANLQRGMRPPQSGLFNVQNDDDGAAMRIAPIGIICAGNPARAAELAAIEASVSHARDGIYAAQAVAACVALAMTSADPNAIFHAAFDYAPVDSWFRHAMEQVRVICEAAHSVEDAWEALHRDLWTPVHSMAAEAIPQALALFKLTGGDFRRGMFWAANFGRDADTISAILGALSGALHGEAVIPDAWKEKVRRPAGVCIRFAAGVDIPTLARALVAL